MKTNGTIVLAHGGGGQLTDELIQESIIPRLANPALNDLLDAALLPGHSGGRLAMSIDSYVVQPWTFPGGDIGQLAVCGTVNDLSVCGARPIGLALSLIISEGFRRRDLEQVLDSVQAAAEEAAVQVITGDTKVVDRASGDGVFITTAGVGHVPTGVRLSPRRVRDGDAVLVNGPIGEHGVAVMLAREMPEVTSVLTTDAAPLDALIGELLDAVGDDVVFMRDPTRGGVAGLVADLARQAQRHVVLDEQAIPVRPEARHAADMLGLDPLDVANEGKVVAVVRGKAADSALRAMRSHRYGRDAAIIGRITETQDGVAELHTVIGGRRVIQKPYGEQLPRIC